MWRGVPVPSSENGWPDDVASQRRLSPYTSRVPLLVRPSGAPAIPSGMAGSISHKKSITVAVATSEFDGIGVDLEYVEESDLALAAKVLTVEERSRLDEIGSSDRAAFVTTHFALKEGNLQGRP